MAYIARLNSDLTVEGNLDALVQPTGSSYSRSLLDRLADNMLLTDMGSVAADTDCGPYLAAVSVREVPAGLYRIRSNTVVSHSISFANGAIISIDPNITLTFTSDIALPDEQVVFSLADTTSTVLLPNRRVSLGWFSIARDGTQDAGPILNSLIANADASGRSIYIPPASSYLLDTVVGISDQNYLTIYGDGRGERSNLDYTLPYPQGPGLPNSVVWPGGGPRFVLGPNVPYGIYCQAPNDNQQYPRVTGINLRGFMVVGNRDASITQTAIAIERDNDTTNIIDIGIINLQTTADSIGLDLRAADSAVIRGLWCAECINSVKLHNSNDLLMTNCSLGAKATGIALGVDTVRRLTFTGNTIYPDGFAAISLSNVRNSVFSANTVTSRFTGIITLFGSYGNLFSDMYVRCPADEGTTWITADKDLWAATNYDPQNRDELYGMIYLDPTSNDNVFSNIQLWSWFDSTSSCGVRIKAGAIGNRLTGLKLVGSAAFVGSANGIVIEGSPSGSPNYSLDCGTAAQHTVGQNAVTRYLS